jgi:predicted negative regulator of RcsB-dependent stress response
MAEDELRQPLKDLFYGEALYYAYQDDYFTAITKLDTELGQYYALDEPALDPFHLHIQQAEFGVGDLELSYRMHQRAGRAIRAVMESTVSPSIRNEAAYRLAKIFFQKNDPVNALHILESIKGEIPEKIIVDEEFLRAQVYIATGKFAEAAQILRELKDDDRLEGFAGYNLGIALIQNGQEKEGIVELDEVGHINSDDPAVLALRDKANLTLGYRMLDNSAPQLARPYLERVRLDGPFSNRALLGTGWVDVSLGDYQRALVPWTMLHKRQVTDASVQEALLAVPYAYGKLDVYGKSAILYGQAMDVFGAEVARLDASIKSIREGKFVQAMLREDNERDRNWLVNIRELPEEPETYYLLDLLASHDFQEALKNYLDLAELRIKVSAWLRSLDVYEDIIEIRRNYYTPLLPVVEKDFKALDSRIKLRLEQRERVSQRLQGMLIARRPEYLASSDERAAGDSLARLRVYLDAHANLDTTETSQRIARLQGLLQWQINTEYDARLTETFEHLRTLDEYIDKLNKTYNSFIRTRQAATQSYEGYEIPIRQFRTRLQQAEVKLNGIMARQGRMMEVMAINELEKRRQKLEDYQIKARFALAESYDRATKKQQQQELEKKQQ